MVATVILSPTALKLVPVPDNATLLIHAGVLAVTYPDVDGVTAKAWVFRRGEWREAWLQPEGSGERLQYVAAEGGQLTDRPGFDSARSPWSE